MTPDLPSLPEPYVYCYEWKDLRNGTRRSFSAAPYNGMRCSNSLALFTAEQMREYAFGARSTAAQPAAQAVIDAAIWWAYCPDEGGYRGGRAVEDTCEALTAAVLAYTGVEQSDYWLTEEAHTERLAAKRPCTPAAAQPAGAKLTPDQVVAIADSHAHGDWVDNYLNLIRDVCDAALAAASGDSTPPSDPVQGDSLACGHHASLLLKSAETGLPLYCELCDAQSGRRDAETVETELRQQLVEAEETIGNLTRALREATEAPTFDPSGALRPEPEAAEEGMPGLLKAMRWAYDNFYVKGYSNGDEREGYISALEDDLPVLFGQVDDLVALVARLARSLRKAAPADALSDRALDYLRRKGLNPSPLRTAEPPQASGERGD